MKSSLIISLFFGISILTYTASAQSTHLQEMNRLNLQIKKGEISSKRYIKKADSLLMTFFLQLSGNIPHDSLVKILEPYYTIVSTEKKMGESKATYFAILATNADIRGKGGQAIFYGGKHDEIATKLGQLSLMGLGLEFNYYSRNNNYAKIIEIYTKKQKELSRFYQEAMNPETNFINGLNLLGVYKLVCLSYAKTNHLYEAREVLAKHKSVANSLLKAKKISKVHFNYINIVLLDQELTVATLAREPAVVYQKWLKDAEQYVKKDASLSNADVLMLQNQLDIMKLEHYLETKNYKEASQILNKQENDRPITHYDSLNYNKPRALIYAGSGNYKAAYEILAESEKLYEKEFTILTDEIAETLYAHSEAEFNRMELQKAEKVKMIRLYWIFGILGAALLTIGAIYIYYFREKRAYQKRMTELAKITDIQIEEARSRAVLDEQQRLGQNLHDDIAGTLASVLHLIKITGTKTTEEPVSENLNQIYAHTRNVYESVRHKSHTIFQQGEQDHFDKSVKKIVDTALPETTLLKEIDVDPETIEFLTTETRVEILRIIQEALANILKHAKSATEVFVFLYRKDNSVLLQIGDNGKQQSSKDLSEGLGLKSIFKRVKTMGGTVEINTEKGMVINIEIPILSK